MRTLCLLALLCVPFPSLAQWTWMPGHPLIPSLLADPLEPAYGVQKDIGRSEIEARVGTLRDLVRYEGRRVLGFERFSFGAGGQAIMQLQLRQIGQKSRLEFPFGFNKQVDFPLQTGDYSFSIYGAAAREAGTFSTRARLHIVHVSAHLGDGRYDGITGTWRESRSPIDYSRNYLQLALDAEHRPTGLRLYIAPALMGYQAPAGGEATPRGFLQGGAEWRLSGGRRLYPFAAADVRTFPRLTGTSARTGTALVAGLRVGAWDQRALELRLAHYGGASWRGQYYGLPERAWSVGFRVHFGG